ncbi:MAG: MGMT family protein [Nanoarchaeota archaeon]
MKTTFAERVYAIIKKIPKGKVATYKDIAHALNVNAYRAVGQALHNNPYAPKVPCHRVIASSGNIGGFAHGSEKKEVLLKKEGVIISNKKINLQRFGYQLKRLLL